MPDLRVFLPQAPDGWGLEIQRKSIRHIYFRVYLDQKKVGVSIPRQVDDQTLASAIHGRADWILKQTAKFPTQKQAIEELGNGDTCYFKGHKYGISVVEKNLRPRVIFDPDPDPDLGPGPGPGLTLQVRPVATREKRDQVLSQWYRDCLRAEIQKLLDKWEPCIGVKTRAFGIRQMKTRWGSCNIQARRIWINLALIRLAPCFLEYVLVHELVHLLERGHNKRFYSFMDKFVPHWKELKKELNQYSLL